MKVSHIITTYNRGHLLDKNFERLVNLTFPDEILVIDDGGRDETANVCNKWSNYLPIKYYWNNSPEHTICSMARNIGVKFAEHDYIVTCEPELIYVTDIIQQLKDTYEEYPEQIISAGNVYFAPQGFEVHTGELTENWQAPGGFQSALGWVAPYTALWKKEWIEELGGWDEGFPGYWGWDDIDLLTRLRINGHGQFIDTNMTAIHQFHGLGGDTDQVNENYFMAKSFIGKGDETKFTDEDKYDLIANRGREWGVLKK